MRLLPGKVGKLKTFKFNQRNLFSKSGFLFLAVGLAVIFYLSSYISEKTKLNTQAAGTDLYVSTSGSDSNNGSQSSPFATIQKAADTATAGNTVHVLPGTYTGKVANTKSGTAAAPITFISDTKWGAKIKVTGSGGSKGYIFRNDGSYVHLIGFDISSTGVSDGVTLNGSHNLAQGNHVHDMTNITCSGSPGGSGLGDDTGSNNIYDGNVVNNIGDGYPSKCDYVHGIYIDDAGDIVENNIAYNNVGNGIYINHETGPVTFMNNTSFANAEYGFGVNGTQAVSGFVIANNISMNNGLAGFKTWSIITGAQYTNNISFNNPTNFVQDGKGTDIGTITSDPQFVNYQANGSGDYHLKAGSPAIDKGIATNAPNHDYDGSARPQGNGYDIGALEYAATAGSTGTPVPSVVPSPTPTSPYVTPTIYCLGSCPTGSLTPTGQPTSTPAPTQSQTTPTPTVNPCNTNQAVSVQAHHNDHNKKNSKNTSSASGWINSLMDLLKQILQYLINFLTQLLGGGGIVLPTPGTATPTPTSSTANPTTTPTTGMVNPTTTPMTSNIPNPTASPTVFNNPTPTVNPCPTNTPAAVNTQPTQQLSSSPSPGNITPSMILSTSPALGNVSPTTSTCNGMYNLNNPMGMNFGDPLCDFTKNGLYTELQQIDPANAEIWFNVVVPCESSYNPNALQPPAQAVDPAGAWGLFQMGRGKNGTYDHGDVVWGMQASNAVNYNNKVINGNWRYWACARSYWK